MPLSNRTYDLGKWLVLVFLPAPAVLVKGLGQIYPLPHIDQVVMTLNLVAAFLGTLLQISSQHYDPKDPQHPIPIEGDRLCPNY